MYISKEDFIWIKSNRDSFAKILYYHFNFKSLNLTHWKIDIISTKDYLIEVYLRKNNGRKRWFVINASGDTRDYLHVDRNESNSTDYYKNLDPIWNQITDVKNPYDNFLTDVMRQTRRDYKLDIILS
jgi:hypothetical protein